MELYLFMFTAGLAAGIVVGVIAVRLIDSSARG